MVLVVSDGENFEDREDALGAECKRRVEILGSDFGDIGD